MASVKARLQLVRSRTPSAPGMSNSGMSDASRNAMTDTCRSVRCHRRVRTCEPGSQGRVDRGASGRALAPQRLGRHGPIASAVH